MRLLRNKQNAWLFLALIVGVVLLASGVHFITYSADQWSYYNQGLDAYQNQDLPTAVNLFNQSIAAYHKQKSSSWLHRFFYPQASDELAALAQFQKAKALLQVQQTEAALEAFKESLRLNPGNQTDGLSIEEAKRLHEEALVVKYDLEMLFKNRPDLAQQQGRGQEQKPSVPQDPGQDPSNRPGKGNRDDI